MVQGWGGGRCLPGGWGRGVPCGAWVSGGRREAPMVGLNSTLQEGQAAGPGAWVLQAVQRGPRLSSLYSLYSFSEIPL